MGYEVIRANTLVLITLGSCLAACGLKQPTPKPDFSGIWHDSGRVTAHSEVMPYSTKVWFAGRKKELIVRGGSNISPQEVEAILYQHPAVAEAGVIGIPDETWGEVVVAYVARKEGVSATEAELIAFAKEQIAAHKVPEQIYFLPSLPKSAVGKVQRRALKEHYRN